MRVTEKISFLPWTFSLIFENFAMTRGLIYTKTYKFLRVTEKISFLPWTLSLIFENFAMTRGLINTKTKIFKDF